MKIRQYIKRMATLALMVAILAPLQEAWGQVKGNKYDKMTIRESLTNISLVSSSGGGTPNNAIDNNENTYWITGSTQTATLVIDLGSSHPAIQFLDFNLGGNEADRATSISVKVRDRNNGNWTEKATISNPNKIREVNYEFEEALTQRYVQLTFSMGNNSWSNYYVVDDLWFRWDQEYDLDYSDQKIQHKAAKWHNLREQSGNRFVDDFSDDEKFFTYNNGTQTLTYQAAHTIVDTLYVRKGSSIVLALPDRREGFDTDDAATNIGSYQCWFNFRTGGIFNTSTSGNVVDDRVVDLLTPTTNGDTYYRFQNGYVNRPLVSWSDKLPARMTFYYPSDAEFNNSGYRPDGQTDNRYYLVACDLSGYMDFSEDGSTASFGAGGTYYEPTLTHRVIYYIVGVDGTWDRPLEEYEIDFPAYTLPNKSNEMVALSMDARSYLAGTNATSLTATISDNNAGIKLVSGNNKDWSATTTDTPVTLSGDDRSIFFRMPNRNNTDGSSYVDNIDNNPTATINVHAGNTLVAKFTLNFKNESRLLTQSIVNALNDGSVTQGATWENLDYRTPESLTNEHTLLTKLDFDYESSYTIRNLFYPYPLSWESNTYGFYDGSIGSDFMGGGATNFYYPEYSSYSLLRSDGGYVESDASWGWRGGFVQGPVPSSILQNSEGNNSTYHLFVDASDRPGLIARLSFEENLCAGSVLYVSAWVKTARWDNSCDNAAVLFTIMGVTKDEDGKETFIPIHRYQTGQIPATYGNNMNTYELNIDGLGDNEWMQAYFSFTNSSELSFDHYVLQVDNNSPSTKGGDIYLDDIRVYISKPLAKVKQLVTACSTKRTLMNLDLDWDRLMARVGGENTNTPYNLAICFVDTLIFHNEYDGTNIVDAIKAAAVDLGQGTNSYHFRVLTYNTTFGSNTEYKDQEGGNLAVDNVDAFYGRTDDDGTRSLSVDFYGAMVPGRAYWVLLVPDVPDEEISQIVIDDDDNKINIVEADVFSGFYGDPCAINADFKVTGDVTLKVDGEIVTPKTEFCRGNVRNFTIDLKIPGLSNPTDSITITEGIYFDWFFGVARDGKIADPMTQYTEKVSMATGTPVAAADGISLQEALVAFRNLYPDATALSETGTPVSEDKGFTQDMYKMINYYLNLDPPVGAQNRPLVLHQPSLNITLLEALRVVVQPIPMSISMDNLPAEYDEAEWARLCWGYTYLELTTTNAAPTVYPGFNTVAYPTDLSGQSLRIGLDQITSVKSGYSNTLTVDLRDAKSYRTTDPENPNTRFTLQLIGGNTNPDETYNKLFLTDTDDPVMKAFIDRQGDSFDRRSLPIGEVEFFQAHYYDEGTTQAVNKMEVQFILDPQTVLINGQNEPFTFAPREGYYYTFNVYFEEYDAGGSIASACYGRFPLTMKVVPEYLVWNDTQKKDDILGNWNYDGNWLRATNTDIKAANTINEYGNDNRAFVPMLFSKVVIPTNSKIQLYQAGYGDNGKWNNEDRPAEVAEPTPNIQYDLMAFEHTGETAGGAGVQEGDLKTERYRVSLLNQIHFEPGAEMLHAEYLLYDTAWVDYELTGGRWYTLASPLKAVYAGDFYTDKSGTEGNEYFQPIYYSESDNSRFNPSVYQRGWKGSKATMVGTPDGERAIAGNWSALYNKVDEAYTPGTGFSLKVQDVTGNATFRLPKADGSYKYYPHSDGQSGNETSVSRVEGEGEEEEKVSGRLQSDQLFIRNTDIDKAGKGAPIEITLSETADGDYYLVGNPFMAHLDMDAFFKEQTFNNIQINNGAVLAWKYWYLDDDGTQVAVTYDEDKAEWISDKENDNFLIPPLRSFFVVKNAEVENNVIKFTQEMQTLGGTGDGLRRANALTITATTTDGRTSRAAVAYSGMASDDYQSSEDAELFLDSNLGDVPMVYTVAGTMASSINVRQNCELVPLGVYGARNEQVTLRFDQVGVFSGVKLYDTKTKSYTTLTDGSEVSVSTNDYGRYYLTGGLATGSEAIRTVDDISIYSVRPGEIVATSAGSSLRSVRVYGIGGELVTQQSLANQSVYRLRVPGNAIYVVYAEDMDGIIRNVKLRVR